MTRAILFAALISVSSAATAMAQAYTDFSPPLPYERYLHSHLSGHSVTIAPYRQCFPVRVFTTPPRPPYYNVPPYSVIAPY